MWKAVWELWDQRNNETRVHKVKGHQKRDEGSSLATDCHREGNSHADAGAKAGLEMHPIDLKAVETARKARALQKMVAKFLVFMQLTVADAGDDCKKFDKRFKPKAPPSRWMPPAPRGPRPWLSYVMQPSKPAVGSGAFGVTWAPNPRKHLPERIAYRLPTTFCGIVAMWSCVPSVGRMLARR